MRHGRLHFGAGMVGTLLAVLVSAMGSSRADTVLLALPEPIVELTRGATGDVVLRLFNPDSADMYINGMTLDGGIETGLTARFDSLLLAGPTVLRSRESWEGVAMTLTGPLTGADSLDTCMTLLGGHLRESMEPLGSVCLRVALATPTCPNQVMVATNLVRQKAGLRAQLAGTPAGTGPFTHQWRRAGIPLVDGPLLAGTQSAVLELAAVAAEDSGDYDVVVTGPCGTATSPTVHLSVLPAAVPVPPYLVAWWPFDDAVNGAACADLAAPDATHHALLMQGSAARQGGFAGQVLDLSPEGSYLASPGPSFPDLGFGGGSFTIDAWVYLNAGAPSTARRPIVVRRTTGGAPRSGYAFYVEQARLRLQLSDAGAVSTMSSTVSLLEGRWNHVAVVVDRPALRGEFYLNGVGAGTFQPGACGRPLDVPLTIGGGTDAEWGHFNGLLDEVHLFRRALPNATVRAIYAASTHGLARGSVTAPSYSWFKRGVVDRSVPMSFRTWDWGSSVFEWSLAGLPPESGCPGSGSIECQPQAGTAAPPARGSELITTAILPFPPTATVACYRLVGERTPGSADLEANGRVEESTLPLRMSAIGDPLQFIPAAGGSVAFRVYNDSTLATTLHYRISSRVRSDVPAAEVLRVGNQLAGAAYSGSLLIPASDSATVTVPVAFEGPHPFIDADILFEFDDYGAVAMRPVASIAVAGLLDTLGVSGVAELPFVNSTHLEGLPNPFFGSTTIRFTLDRRQQVQADIFDVAGRLIRQLHAGMLEAGPHELHWNGQNSQGADCSAGVYFLRLKSTAFALRTKLVRLQ